MRTKFVEANGNLATNFICVCRQRSCLQGHDWNVTLQIENERRGVGFTMRTICGKRSTLGAALIRRIRITWDNI